MLGIRYFQETSSFLRTGPENSGKTNNPYANMDCSEFVCRVLAADGITDGVQYMTSSALQTFFSDQKKFVHSMTPQAGDIAIWDGHVGIVGAAKNGKMKLIGETHPGGESQENPYFITPDQEVPGKHFYGYYRPIKETPDGKVKPNSQWAKTNIQSTTTTTHSNVISRPKKPVSQKSIKNSPNNQNKNNSSSPYKAPNPFNNNNQGKGFGGSEIKLNFNLSLPIWFQDSGSNESDKIDDDHPYGYTGEHA
jgi:CHAP domain